MYCPYCNHSESRVIDSREAPEGVRRRRECLQCGLRYTTYERIQSTALMVAKRDGRREDFHRDKLIASILKACVKRPLPTGTIEKLVDDIETELQGLGRAEILSSSVGEMVTELAGKVGENIACQAEFTFVLPENINDFLVKKGKKEK